MDWGGYLDCLNLEMIRSKLVSGIETYISFTDSFVNLHILVYENLHANITLYICANVSLL